MLIRSPDDKQNKDRRLAVQKLPAVAVDLTPADCQVAHHRAHLLAPVPVRQWVLIWAMRLPMPLRLLVAEHPKLVTADRWSLT